MRYLVLVCALCAALALAVAPASPAIAPAVAAKPCSSGWVHGVIGGAHKCLRAGQFCARAADRQYHRVGYHCHKYDVSVSRYRLTG